MSGGMSGTDLFTMISGLGDAFGKSYDSAKKDALAADLGDKVQSGDLAGAAQTAFKGGDLQTGLALMKLGQGQGANSKFADLMGRYLGAGQGDGGMTTLGDLTSGYRRGGTGGAGDTAPSTGTAPGGGMAAPPSFSQSGGAIGDYLAQTRARESGGNDAAANPNSTALGRYQFTAGTWRGLMKDHPELNLTADGRLDPTQQERAMQQFTANNANYLRDNGVPINPGTLYGAHFLGAGGAVKFIKTAINNPDIPAASIAPTAAAANRPVFFNRDGSPKSAGEVYAWLGGGKAPSGPATVATLSGGSISAGPAARVSSTSGDDDASAIPASPQASATVPAPQAGGRMMTMPGAPTGGQPSLGMPAADAITNLGTPNPVPASFTTAGAGSGTIAAPPQASAPQAQAAPSTPVVPTAGAPPSRSAVIADTASMARAGLPLQTAFPIAQAPQGSPRRISLLVQASLIPGLSEQQQGLVKTFLSNELEASKLTSDQKEYALAHGQGFRGSFLDYKAALRGDDGAKIGRDVAARGEVLRQQGLDPADPRFQSYRLTGNLPAEKEAKTPDGVLKLNEALTNWQRYGLPDPQSQDPADRAYWKDFSTKALGGGAGVTVNTNVDTKGETAEAQELGKTRGKRAGDIEAAAAKAPDQIGKLNLLSGILDRARTGAFGPTESTVVGLAQAAGIPDTTIAKLGLNPQQAISAQAATKLINEAVTGMIGGGGFPANNFSDADRTFLQDIFPKMSNRPEANRLAIEVLKRVQQRNLDFGDRWAEYQQAQREAGKPASVGEFEFNYRKGLRDKPGLFDDVRQQFEGLGRPDGGSGAGGGGAGLPGPASAPRLGSVPIPPREANTLRSSPDTAEARAAFDGKYGEGAAQRVLKRPLAQQSGTQDNAPTVPAAARFKELTAGGLSKQDAYARMHQEGY